MEQQINYKLHRLQNVELTFLLQVRNLVGHEVVEGVVTTLKGLLVGETGLLEQVDHHVGSRQLSGRVEVDTDELSKPGGVVVSCGLGIAVRLENWVSRHDLVLEGDFLFHLLSACAGCCQGEVGDHLKTQK